MVNNLIMIAYGGMFILGKIDERKLIEPRLYQLVQVAPRQFQHQTNHFPGSPPFISLPKDFIYYPVTDKEIEGVYIKATTRIELVTSRDLPAVIQ